MPKPGGLLYAIGAEGTSLVKIGYTRGSVETRLQRLQTGQPFPLQVIATLPVESDVSRKEALLHAFLATERRRGEWFEVDLTQHNFAELLERAIQFGIDQAVQRREEKKSRWLARHPPVLTVHGLDLAQFGARVKEMRQNHGFTQQELADLMAAPQGWLSELENARQTHVQADTVFRLCQALNVSADYLMGLAPELPAPPRRARQRKDDHSG